MHVRRLCSIFVKLLLIKQKGNMSKKFKVVHRESGEVWTATPEPHIKKYLVLYDSGYAAVVTQEYYTHIEPLDSKVWKVVFKEKS